MSKNPGAEFSSTDMANKFVNELYVHEYKKKNKTPTKLSVEINNKIKYLQNTGKAPQIKLVEGSSPKRHYWDDSETGGIVNEVKNEINELPDSLESAEAKRPRRKNKQPEEELYAPLMDFLAINEKVYPFPIKHGNTPSKRGTRGRRKWKHPDIVGVQGIGEKANWNSTIRQLSGFIKPVQAKLWSFELKDRVTRGTVAECYNQAISNSSWANFGYLCVGGIDGRETKTELKILNNRHGIGVIFVDRNDFYGTHILFPAQERKDVDLDFCQNLIENKEFERFLLKAINVYKTGEVL